MHVGSRIASVAAVCALLGGCGGMAETPLTSADLTYSHPHPRETAAADFPSTDYNTFPDAHDDSAAPPSTIEGTHLQCVPYARDHSGVSIFGNANTWWAKAAGVYARGDKPLLGSVMVLDGYSRHRGHVAVVRSIYSPREIHIDHANWLDDGAIYVNDPVMDVSADNDWSQVKVWNIRSGSWGTRTYHVEGFIGPGREGAPVVAANDRPVTDDPIARQIATADTDSDDSDDDR